MIVDMISSLLISRATGDLSHRMLLTPAMGVVQDKGFRVALVTKGRMSSASGKVPAEIPCSPEALGGGTLRRLHDGDVVMVRAERGLLEAVGVDLAARDPATPPPAATGPGRELFFFMRHGAVTAELGGSAMLAAMEQVG